MIKNKKLKVMIGTPCYGGQLTEAYQRLIAGDDTPSTRIIPATGNSFYS